jgi:hypothetical protein
MRKLMLLIIASFAIVSLNAQTDPKPPKEDYVGKYVFPDGSVVPDVTVSIAGDALNMSSQAGSSVLTELGKDSFSIIEFNGVAVFKRGDDKKVNAVHIEAQGYVLDGQKQSNGSWAFTYYIRSKEFITGKKIDQKS